MGAGFSHGFDRCHPEIPAVSLVKKSDGEMMSGGVSYRTANYQAGRRISTFTPSGRRGGIVASAPAPNLSVGGSATTDGMLDVATSQTEIAEPVIVERLQFVDHPSQPPFGDERTDSCAQGGAE
jgi:hypothetical protein